MVSTEIKVEMGGAKMHLLQRQREENARLYAQQKARERQMALVATGALAEVDAVRKDADSAVDVAIKAFEDYLSLPHSTQSKAAKYGRFFLLLNVEERAALVSDTLDVLLNAVDVVSQSTIINRLGDLVELTLNMHKQRRRDAKMTARLKVKLEVQPDAAARRSVITYTLKCNQQVWQEWPQDIKTFFGQVLFHVVVDHTDLFEREVREVRFSSKF